MTVKKLSFILFLVCLASVTVLSLIPSPPKLPGSFEYIDKAEHAAAYAVLSMLLLMSLPEFRKKITGVLVCVLMLAGYGILMEFIQSFTGRSPELADFAADLAGIVLGLIAKILLTRVIRTGT